RFKALNPKAQVLSFNWGPWDGGMVTPELKRMFTERGVYIIPLDAGAQLMLNELAANDNRSPQILVGNDLSKDQKEAASVKKPQVSRLTKSIEATNNTFLTDHVIGGDSVLPTVCAIQWMSNAAQTVYSGYHYQGLENYKLFKGIVFDGAQAGDYSIDLKLVVDNGETLKVEAKISSTIVTGKGKGKPVFHYGADLLLTRKPLAGKSVTLDIPTVNGATHDLYQDGTLFHGDSLQGIKAVLNCDSKGLLLACQVAESAADKQGEFPLEVTNIFADDLVYQAMLVWVRDQMKMGSLPSSTQSWTVYRQPLQNELFYLQLNVVKQTGNTLVADIQDGTRLVDEEQFGPVLPFIRYSSVDEAVHAANGTEYGLDASVWTSDAEAGKAVVTRLQA
ncbi:MAG: aldehyde dehydrogenase family protein, partial [Psychrosphaera sp.]|nr:aldehyde dehydrogenase family protein [Psychrosphaera sp.]